MFHQLNLAGVYEDFAPAYQKILISPIYISSLFESRDKIHRDNRNRKLCHKHCRLLDIPLLHEPITTRFLLLEDKTNPPNALIIFLRTFFSSKHISLCFLSRRILLFSQKYCVRRIPIS